VSKVSQKKIIAFVLLSLTSQIIVHVTDTFSKNGAKMKKHSQTNFNIDGCSNTITSCFENFDANQYQKSCNCMLETYPTLSDMCSCLETIYDDYYYMLCGCAFLQKKRQ